MATGLLTMVEPVSPAPAVVLATAAEEEAAAVGNHALACGRRPLQLRHVVASLFQQIGK